MTNKLREKSCFTCGNIFTERLEDSDNQWQIKQYCSQSCNGKSPKRKVSIFERLKRYQIKKEGCWAWSGCTDNRGYGTLSNRKGKNFSPEKAHRVSYEFYKGNIPDGMSICHSCDNPECTNPDHLWVGTHKENMQDCGRKGRVNQISKNNLTFNHEKALTQEQVEEIKNIKYRARNGRGEGKTKKEVAKQYGVCIDLITMIIKGTYYGKCK